MLLTKLFMLCCLTWALFGEGSGSETNLTKNFDLDSIISNLFGNQPSYPGNSQSYPSMGQQNPQYHEPSNVNNINSGNMRPGTMNPGNMSPGTMNPGNMSPGTMNPGNMSPGTMNPGNMSPGTMNPGNMSPGTMNPGNGYQGYPSNGRQDTNPQSQRPGNGFNNDPRYDYRGRPSGQGYPPYQDIDNGINNINPGNSYPSSNYPGYYQGRPNQINNPQGNVWNNANENPGINYPGGSPFFPGSSSQGNPQYRPGSGFSGNPPHGYPGNYPSNPGMGGNWNGMNGNPGFNYDPNGFNPNFPQRRPNWNNPNGYPGNQSPNQISVPGNQFQTQGVGSQGFDQQNPDLIQGQPIQFPQGGLTYTPGQNGGSFNPSQGTNGLNNQLPNLQNKPNFKPNQNYPDQKNGHFHKNGLNLLTSTEKNSDLEKPAISKSPSLMKQCVQDCPSSTEYRPLCGSDGVTYFNEERVQCARKCGFGFPPYQDLINGLNNINPGNSYPSSNYPGYYQGRPN